MVFGSGLSIYFRHSSSALTTPNVFPADEGFLSLSLLKAS